MLLTKFSHSCVRLEKDGAVLVVDLSLIHISEPTRPAA